jgi:oligo-1,6-glucosidase
MLDPSIITTRKYNRSFVVRQKILIAGSMKTIYSNNEEKRKEAHTVLQRTARDNTRTPVQWTSEKNAGFCPPNITPWMRVNDDYLTINAQEQTKDSNDSSVYHFWQKSLAFRKLHKDVLVYGDFAIVGDLADDKVIAYKRFSSNKAFVVVLNFSGDQIRWNIPKDIQVVSWFTQNYPAKDISTHESLKLEPWEGLIGEIVI